MKLWIINSIENGKYQGYNPKVYRNKEEAEKHISAMVRIRKSIHELRKCTDITIHKGMDMQIGFIATVITYISEKEICVDKYWLDTVEVSD